MDAVVVASHLPDEGHFRSERFDVRPVLCRGDLDYWKGLATAWGEDATIVNLEHDLEVSDEHIAQLLDCPHILCSHAYQCHWISMGVDLDPIAAGTGNWERHLEGGEEWADWSAIGLVKITPEARRGDLRCEPWNTLERAVHDAVVRPWHMHWQPELPHHHW